jgi:hypothetical protein
MAEVSVLQGKSVDTSFCNCVLAFTICPRTSLINLWVGDLVHSGRALCVSACVDGWTFGVARKARSLVQSYPCGCAMDRFAHAPLMPSDVEGYDVAAQMARRIGMMCVVSE